MFASKVKWLISFNEARAKYEELTIKNRDWCTKVDPDTAFAIYLRATNPSLKMAVMGRTIVDTKRKTIDFGNAIDQDVHRNFGINSHNSELTSANAGISGPHNGSVLHFYADNASGRLMKGGNTGGWHFAYNDSWILGGVHAQVEFHLASPRRKDNVVNPIYGLTVTGRELVGLKTFGYTFRTGSYFSKSEGKMVNLNEIAVCVDKGKADKANYSSYIDAVEYYSKNTGAAVADLVNPAA